MCVEGRVARFALACFGLFSFDAARLALVWFGFICVRLARFGSVRFLLIGLLWLGDHFCLRLLGGGRLILVFFPL